MVQAEALVAVQSVQVVSAPIFDFPATHTVIVVASEQVAASVGHALHSAVSR